MGELRRGAVFLLAWGTIKPRYGPGYNSETNRRSIAEWFAYCKSITSIIHADDDVGVCVGYVCIAW